MRKIILPLLVALAPAAAFADDMSWRVATVVSSQQDGQTVRRGVAIFSNGEPALVTLRLKPTAPPSGVLGDPFSSAEAVYTVPR